MATARVLAAGLTACLACGEGGPGAPSASEPAPTTGVREPATSDEPAPTAPPGRDPELLARFPSLAHYPRVPPELAAGLRARDAAAIFRGLELAFLPDRWAEVDDWERLAHIRVAAPAGFHRTEAGAPVRLSPGTYDLGCLGGFLEAVRLLWLPRLELVDLVPCDPPRGFESCEGGAHAGRAALLQIAARLPDAALPRGLELLDLRVADVLPGALVDALDAGALHLCTVSHRARARTGERMYHHMMIVDPARDRLGRVRVFDTTGVAGVALRPMRPARLHDYVRRLLSFNDVFRYDPDSAQLTCLAVARPDALAPSPAWTGS